MAEGAARSDLGAGRVLASLPFRVVVVLHAVLLTAQPVLAGAVLDGADGPLVAHRAVGGVLILVGMIQVPAAVLAWRPGRWPFWPSALSAAVVVGEIVQVATGHGANLSLHVPLGVTIVAGCVALAVWSLRPGPRRPG